MRGSVRHLVTTVAAGVLAAGVGFSPALKPAPDEPDDPSPAGLAGDLDEIVTDESIDGGQAAVVVQDAESGEVVYEHDPDRRLMPASNEKLLTSAVAMDVLGPDHTFTTTVETAASQSGPVLRGDVFLRGGGDPTMLAEDYGELAAQIADAGVRTVRGDVVADDSRYYGVELGPDWAWDDEPYYYAAPVSALTAAPNTDYDAGTVLVDVGPGAQPGEPAQVRVKPESANITVENHATTAQPTTGMGITVTRDHGSDVIDVRGDIDADAGVGSHWVSVENPTTYAAGVFEHELEERGVRVTGETATGPTPDDATVVAEHVSMPLSELMVPFMKLSNNGHAEVLIKELGHEVSDEGTWNMGLDVMHSELESVYGVDVQTISSRDGSGLSRRNMIPPAQIANVLQAAQDRPWFDAWYDALPIAGEDDRMVGGTLRSRMTGTPAEGNVHAKTGSLTGASALSGYVTDADGRQLIFAVMFNDYLGAKPSELEDRIAVRLAEHSEESGAQDRSVTDVPAVDLPDQVECSWVKAC